MLLNILNNTMINIVGNKKLKEYKIKLEGGENMLALYEMIENERNEIYSTGIKRDFAKNAEIRLKTATGFANIAVQR